MEHKCKYCCFAYNVTLFRPNVKIGLFWTMDMKYSNNNNWKRLWIYFLEYNSWAMYRPISGFLGFMLRPEYENSLRILIIIIPESEIEIAHKIPSWVWAWVWDLLVITTPVFVESGLAFSNREVKISLRQRQRVRERQLNIAVVFVTLF